MYIHLEVLSAVYREPEITANGRKEKRCTPIKVSTFALIYYYTWYTPVCQVFFLLLNQCAYKFCQYSFFKSCCRYNYLLGAGFVN